MVKHVELLTLRIHVQSQESPTVYYKRNYIYDEQLDEHLKLNRR